MSDLCYLIGIDFGMIYCVLLYVDSSMSDGEKIV